MKRKSEVGFTVIELIMCMVVGSIMIAVASLALTSQNHLTQRDRDLALANAYVEAKVEALRSTGFLSLTNGTTNITTELPTELNASRSGSLVVSSYSTSIKQVDISITYNDQGASRSYSYTTFISELGVGQN